MPVFYSWCGLIACLSIMVISYLNNEDVSFKSLFKRFFWVIAVIIFSKFFLAIFLLAIIYNFMPEIWEAFLRELGSYLYKVSKESFILHMAPNVLITPSDPFNQLKAGYNPNGANQPIARNIVSELDRQYRTKSAQLSGRILPPLIQQFIADYFRFNDPDKLQKIMKNTRFRYKPQWQFFYNTRSLRKGLRNLP